MRKTSAKAAWISAAMGRSGGDATPWVFSGTLVVKGHGLALLETDRDRHRTPAGSARP